MIDIGQPAVATAYSAFRRIGPVRATLIAEPRADFRKGGGGAKICVNSKKDICGGTGYESSLVAAAGFAGFWIFRDLDCADRGCGCGESEGPGRGVPNPDGDA